MLKLLKLSGWFDVSSQRHREIKTRFNVKLNLTILLDLKCCQDELLVIP